jgi:hypothetical protein
MVVERGSSMDERSERIAKRFEIPMLIAAALVIPTVIIRQRAASHLGTACTGRSRQ